MQKCNKRAVKMLPNLVVIGAMKCATTSLHYYLNLHPEITMVKEKELDFFILEKNWKKGVQWYESHFINGTKICGESSPNYTKYPWFEAVPERMYSLVPDAKLIYILRDPIDRIVSEYVHHCITGTEKRSISEALRNLKNNYYIDNSKYYMQLEQYVRFYSQSKILILITEELKRQPQKVLQNVFRFLEIDDTFFDVDYPLNKLHMSSEKKRKNWIGRFLTQKFGESVFKNKIRGLFPSFVAKMYVSLTRTTANVEKPKLNNNLKQKLVDELIDDIDQLRSCTGYEFADWCL